MTESDKDALIVSLKGINAMNGEQMEALESELDNFTAVSADVDDEIKWYKKMIDLAHKYGAMDYVMRKLVH